MDRTTERRRIGKACAPRSRTRENARRGKARRVRATDSAPVLVEDPRDVATRWSRSLLRRTRRSSRFPPSTRTRARARLALTLRRNTIQYLLKLIISTYSRIRLPLIVLTLNSLASAPYPSLPRGVCSGLVPGLRRGVASPPPSHPTLRLRSHRLIASPRLSRRNRAQVVEPYRYKK